MSSLTHHVFKGLNGLSKQHTIDELGDRSTYFGASEIGQCPRKTILSKIIPSRHSLRDLIRFKRGHMCEDIIAEALTFAGYKFQRQPEFVFTDTATSLILKAHVDFTFFTQTTIFVVEVKSVGKTGIPKDPYESQEEQLFLQMGLLKRQYPHMKVVGCLFYIDLDGEVKLVDGYEPSNSMLVSQIEYAQDIWLQYQQAKTVSDPIVFCADTKTLTGPLCTFCDFAQFCPRMIAEEITGDLADYVQETRSLMDEIKALEKKVKARKAKIKEVIDSRNGEKFSSGGCLVKLAERSRTKIDNARLEADLEGVDLDMDDYRSSYSFSFIDIKPIKNWVAKAA